MKASKYHWFQQKHGYQEKATGDGASDADRDGTWAMVERGPTDEMTGAVPFAKGKFFEAKDGFAVRNGSAPHNASEYWSIWEARQLSQSDYPRATPRLDLAVEAHEVASGASDAGSIDGVIVDTDESDEDVRVSHVKVQTPTGAVRIGKHMGNYVSIEAPKLRHRDPDLQSRVVNRFADAIQSVLNVDKKAPVLVVGLGNAQVTPDSLGPLVVEKLFVTRHLIRTIMPELEFEGYRIVSAISPGVLGITGIETQEVIEGIVEHVQPQLVIAIDALASRSLHRVNSTIQVADNGIHPGSGVGNHRKGLTVETLGVPVIGVGVPTVVDAATIASDAMEMVEQKLQSAVPGNGASEILGKLGGQEKWQMVKELLEPLGNNLMVTPKEIDEFVEDVANIIAKGLNLALHEGMSLEEANLLTH